MSRGSMTDDEKRKVIEKGRRWLVAYLGEMAEDCLSDTTRKHMCRVMGDKYRAFMETDEEFYENVAAFVSARRTSSEKEAFFRSVVTLLIKNGVRSDYAKRYPDEYSPVNISG